MTQRPDPLSALRAASRSQVEKEPAQRNLVIQPDALTGSAQAHAHQTDIHPSLQQLFLFQRTVVAGVYGCQLYVLPAILLSAPSGMICTKQTTPTARRTDMLPEPALHFRQITRLLSPDRLLCSGKMRGTGQHTRATSQRSTAEFMPPEPWGNQRTRTPAPAAIITAPCRTGLSVLFQILKESGTCNQITEVTNRIRPGLWISLMVEVDDVLRLNISNQAAMPFSRTPPEMSHTVTTRINAAVPQRNMPLMLITPTDSYNDDAKTRTAP